MSELTQLYLMTPDLEASRRFYEEGLRLSPTRVGESSCSYKTGTCELKLQADFSEGVLREYNLDPPGENRGEGSIFVLAVEQNIDALHEHLTSASKKASESVLTAPQNVPWGERMFLVCDPNGYVFEIRRKTKS